ncbi:MAG: hypothetical protein M1838_005597, partial [Thelocarpon superellum]
MNTAIPEMPQERLSTQLLDQTTLENEEEEATGAGVSEGNEARGPEQDSDEAPPSDAQHEPASLSHLCTEIHARVTAFLETPTTDEQVKQVQGQTRTTLDVIHDALRRYRLDELSLSYNGGKDCLVLLFLLLAALSTHKGALPPRLQSVYIIPPSPFALVESFVARSSDAYHLQVARYALPMRPAFGVYLHEHRQVKAIFVGTRRTDPHGANLTHFDPTDHGWPSFMRIHPVIDWHYAEIWTFIRALKIPYCGLYDLGYTSLGGTNDTRPNPALRRDPDELSGQGKGRGEQGEDNTHGEHFRPAYELTEDHEERL